MGQGRHDPRRPLRVRVLLTALHQMLNLLCCCVGSCAAAFHKCKKRVADAAALASSIIQTQPAVVPRQHVLQQAPFVQAHEVHGLMHPTVANLPYLVISSTSTRCVSVGQARAAGHAADGAPIAWHAARAAARTLARQLAAAAAAGGDSGRAPRATVGRAQLVAPPRGADRPVRLPQRAGAASFQSPI